MILSSHHQLLVSSSRTTTSTIDMTSALLLVSEEEQLTSSNDEAPAPVTPTNAVSTTAPFPASDSPPSRHYDYSVGHFASPKSEGTTSKRTCSCWKLNDFTSTTPDSFTGTSTGSSSHLGEGMFGTVDLYKERKNDNLLVALKTMSKAESNDRRRLLWKREVELQTRYVLCVESILPPYVGSCDGVFKLTPPWTSIPQSLSFQHSSMLRLLSN